MTPQKYNVDFLVYSNTQILKTNCNSLQFVNLGTSAVTIQQAATLITGQTLTIEGNANEICVTDFAITFDNTGTNNCLIIKKSFV